MGVAVNKVMGMSFIAGSGFLKDCVRSRIIIIEKDGRDSMGVCDSCDVENHLKVFTSLLQVLRWSP